MCICVCQLPLWLTLYFPNLCSSLCIYIRTPRGWPMPAHLRCSRSVPQNMDTIPKIWQKITIYWLDRHKKWQYSANYLASDNCLHISWRSDVYVAVHHLCCSAQYTPAVHIIQTIPTLYCDINTTLLSAKCDI